MTLNGYFALNSVFAPDFVASDRATFENCVKTNKDHRHVLSAVQIFDRDSAFWQYKICANIRAGSLEKRRQRTRDGTPFLGFQTTA